MEYSFDVLWKLFQDLILRLGGANKNDLLCLILKLRNLAPQWVFLEVGLIDFWMHLDVSFFGLFEQLPLDFTLVANEELLFVDVAPVRMSLGHVTSKLLRFVELLLTDFALVHGNIAGLFLTLFSLPFIFGDRTGSLYPLLLIFKRFQNV